jgi:hypothetical protein
MILPENDQMRANILVNPDLGNQLSSSALLCFLRRAPSSAQKNSSTAQLSDYFSKLGVPEFH